MFNPIAKLMTVGQSMEDTLAGSEAGAYKLFCVQAAKLVMLELPSKGLFDMSQLDPNIVVS